MINGKKRGLKRSRFFSKLFESNRSLFAGDVDEQVDEEIYDWINQAVESLPEQCRLIIKLNVIEGKKYLEISEEYRNTNQYDSYTSFPGIQEIEGYIVQ